MIDLFLVALWSSTLYQFPCKRDGHHSRHRAPSSLPPAEGLHLMRRDAEMSVIGLEQREEETVRQTCHLGQERYIGNLTRVEMAGAL